MQIVFIGAGNVATHMALALKAAGNQIIQVFSRTENNAIQLAKRLNTAYTTVIADILNADLYIYSISDNAIQDIIKKVEITSGIHAHTAGSVSIDIFGSKFQKTGVIYPLQTFSKEKEVDFKKVPVFVEGSNIEVKEELLHLCNQISNICFEANSSKRMKMHVAAVFACNFTNYFYQIAYQLTENEGITFNILKPLILETANKINHLTPFDAQTGPARRNDKQTIKKHLDEIKDKDLKKLYEDISNQIIKAHQF